MEVGIIDGSFREGEVLTGSESGDDILLVVLILMIFVTPFTIMIILKRQMLS